jgi:midasin (ATPase involved in ribosome maturation)
MLDHVKIRNVSEIVEKFTHWERFLSLTSQLTSINIEINWEVEAYKPAHDFTASIVSAYTLSTNKITLTVINNNIPGLDRFLKHF